MAARCPAMEPSPGRTARRRSGRGTCLAVALLCLLAATTGALARSDEPAHHHHYALGVATASLDSAVSHGTRSAPDLAVAERADSDPASGRPPTMARSTAPPAGTRDAPVRTRGPPATA